MWAMVQQNWFERINREARTWPLIRKSTSKRGPRALGCIVWLLYWSMCTLLVVSMFFMNAQETLLQTPANDQHMDGTFNHQSKDFIAHFQRNISAHLWTWLATQPTRPREFSTHLRKRLQQTPLFESVSHVSSKYYNL